MFEVIAEFAAADLCCYDVEGEIGYFLDADFREALWAEIVRLDEAGLLWDGYYV